MKEKLVIILKSIGVLLFLYLAVYFHQNRDFPDPLLLLGAFGGWFTAKTYYEKEKL